MEFVPQGVKPPAPSLLSIVEFCRIDRCEPKVRVFKNFIFAEIGVVDAGNFKGAEEISHLQSTIARETQRYADYMNAHGIHSEAIYELSPDVISGAQDLAERLSEKFPNITFFGGQLVFAQENYFTHILHNFAVFGLQRQFFKNGLPFIVLPIRV